MPDKYLNPTSWWCLAPLTIGMISVIFGLIVILPATVVISAIYGNLQHDYVHDVEATCYVYNSTIENVTCGQGCSSYKVDCNGPTRVCYNTQIMMIVAHTLLTNPEAARPPPYVPYIAIDAEYGLTLESARDAIALYPIGYNATCYYDGTQHSDVSWTTEESPKRFLGAMIALWVLFFITVPCALVVVFSCACLCGIYFSPGANDNDGGSLWLEIPDTTSYDYKLSNREPFVSYRSRWLNAFARPFCG